MPFLRGSIQVLEICNKSISDPKKRLAPRIRPNRWPSNKSDISLGLVSWYRRFIANFSAIIAPLTRFTKKNARWNWEPDEAAVFEKFNQHALRACVPGFIAPIHSLNRRQYHCWSWCSANQTLQEWWTSYCIRQLHVKRDRAWPN